MPPRDGSRVRRVGRPVPGLHHVEGETLETEGPRTLGIEGVVQRHDRARRARGRHRVPHLLEAVGERVDVETTMARGEVEVRVATVVRVLHPGDRRDAVEAGDLVVLPGAVVIGEGDEIEAAATGQLDDLHRAQPAVAVDGVHVQVAREQDLFLPGKPDRDRHLDRAADLVQAQCDRPPAGAYRAGGVAGRGRRGGDATEARSEPDQPLQTPGLVVEAEVDDGDLPPWTTVRPLLASRTWSYAYATSTRSVSGGTSNGSRR